MTRRPACPPLFPYTTLFRSEAEDDSDGVVGRQRLARLVGELALEGDQKSTGLGSNHERNAYAVYDCEDKCGSHLISLKQSVSKTRMTFAQQAHTSEPTSMHS